MPFIGHLHISEDQMMQIRMASGLFYEGTITDEDAPFIRLSFAGVGGIYLNVAHIESMIEVYDEANEEQSDDDKCTGDH